MVRFRPTREFAKEANQLFLEQRRRVLRLLPYAKIKHIGSTAISGALTKGDLDIFVIVPRSRFKGSIARLRRIYKVNQLKNWTKSFASFKDDSSFGLKFGLQLVSDVKKYDFLIHVNLFKKNPRLLRQYNELKQKYHGKRMRDYRKAKEQFLTKLVKHNTS